MKNTIILLVTFYSFFINAQIISGKVVDTKNIPIKNARIGIQNSEIGDISNIKGEFKIDITNIDKDENLKVIVSEYLPFEIKISDFLNTNQQIVLNEKVINIEPVVINQKKYKLKNFGTSNSKRAYSSYNSDNKSEIYTELAIKVENRKKLKIKNININIVSFKLNKPAILIFDIQNSKNGFPDDSQSLTNETLKLVITENDIKKNKVSLDVSDKNIWTDSDFFVLLRVDESLDGNLYIGGNIFAFSKSTYYRKYYSDWKKFAAGEPSINVDVLIEK